MKKIIWALALCFVLGVNSNLEATIIYSEDFTGQDGQGAVGTGADTAPTVDTTGVDWTIDILTAELTAASDFFTVVGEAFTAQDLDGTGATWFSPVIATTPGETIDFSLLAGGSDAGQFEEIDTYLISYLVDGASVSLPDLVPAVDTFDAGTITETGIAAGSTFQLQVNFLNNAGAENFTLDDIVVNSVASIPEPSSAALFGLAGLALCGMRRRSA